MSSLIVVVERRTLAGLVLIVLLSAVLGTACDTPGACYYDEECIGCGSGMSTIIVRYCYNSDNGGWCDDETNYEFREDECCDPEDCDTVLNPEDCDN